MDCEIIQVEQRSDEWDALRRCRITASRLGDVMAKPTTLRYKRLQQKLILELTGKVYIDEEEVWFAHGKQMEPRAVGAMEWKYGWRVVNDIFLIHHKYDWFGCSPDGMINDYREGLEVKSRSVYQQYMKAREKGVEPAHRFQIQGAMWMTGLPMWWYLNYYENPKDGTRKLSRVAVERDDALIEKMETRCVEFMDEVYQLAGLK